MRSILRGTSRLSIRGGLGIIDARDLGLAHARLFSGHERDRYLMSGRWVAFEDIFRTLEAVVAHRLPRMRLPGKVAFAAARAADAAQRRGIDPGFSSEATWIVLNWPVNSDDVALRELGVVPRPFVDTLRDTVAWLHEQGRVSRRQAGAAADHDWAPGEPPTSDPT